MLDLQFIRNNPDKVKKAIEDKGEDKEKANVDQLLEHDKERRKLLQETESLRNKKNKASEKVASLKKEGKDANDIIEDMKEVSKKIKELETELNAVNEKIYEIQIWIPNIPSPDTPIGTCEEDNEEIRRWGERKEFDFEPKPHWEIAEALDIIDFKRGSKIAGTGFPMFKGKGARLVRGILNFMLDIHIKEHGYKEVWTPIISDREGMFGCGQIPKMEDDMYVCEKDDLFLIPTAEVPITNIHRNEILNEQSLPLYYAGYTPCFRREAGAHGRDTRGLIRIHQFDKVELVKYVKPNESYDELEKLTQNAEKIIQLLGLEYRTVAMCTGDMSFASAKSYDIELWAPGVQKYLEVSSCSNFEDFQARRLNIRFKGKDKKMHFVHTLNGSGVAFPRLIIALLETYQNKDKTVNIPEPLAQYVGMKKIECNS